MMLCVSASSALCFLCCSGGSEPKFTSLWLVCGRLLVGLFVWSLWKRFCGMVFDKGIVVPVSS